MLAQTPSPPYYAVIFTSIRTAKDQGYNDTSKILVELAVKQSGFLGMDSARNDVGITVSYWKDLKSIEVWKNNATHSIARTKGRSHWYQHFTVRIALVERDYQF